jgi:hypothetical protein
MLALVASIHALNTMLDQPGEDVDGRDKSPTMTERLTGSP